MNFALDAGGSQALGQGLGNLFKTAAMGQMYGQQAEMNAALKSAMMQQHLASADKATSEAERGRASLTIQNDPLENTMLSLGLPRALAPAFRNKIDTGSWGGGYDMPAYDGVGPTMPAPASDDTVKKLAQAMSITQRTLATGSKVNQGTDAALDEQRMRSIDAVVANPALAPNYGKANAASVGKPLFDNVGNTGYSIDSFTGGQAEANPVLAKLFSSIEGSKANENNAQARNANASARKYMLEGNALEAGGGKPMTEGQAKSLLFGGRMLESGKVLNSLESSGITDTGIAKNIVSGGVGIFSDRASEASESMLRFTMSKDQKLLDQAQRDFVNATLRRESGAAISPVEFTNAQKQYFPQVGDTQEVIAQKRRNRELATKLILSEVPEGHRYKGQEVNSQINQPATQQQVNGWNIRRLD